jgi:hypothetical protein
MKITTVKINDKDVVVSSGSISTKVRRNRIKGVYNNSAQSPLEIMNKRHGYNFPKEFDKYVETNYGDVLSEKDKKRLKKVVEEHYEDGCIGTVKSLHKHIHILGERINIIFD